MQKQCNNLVDTYGPAIIEMIKEQVEANDICKLLKLCDSSQTENLGESLTSYRDEISVQSLNPVEMQKKEDSTCATCSYVVSMVLDQVKSSTIFESTINLYKRCIRVFRNSIRYAYDLG